MLDGNRLKSLLNKVTIIDMSKNLTLALFAFFVVFWCSAQRVDVDNGYEKGRAENGFKVGQWEYYGFDNSLELKIDYNEGTVLYLKQDTTSYFVQIDSTWRYEKVDSYPRYIGSTVELYNILSSNLMYPLKARMKDVQKTVFLEFEVDTQGQVVNARVINDDEKYFTEEILAAFDVIPNLWLTATYDGKSVPAKFVLPFYFKLTGGRRSPDFDKDALSALDGKKLNEMVVSAPRAR